jgi:ribosome-associated protein
LALAIAGAASDKKALDIVIMKMKKMSSVCDYFVIASGTSTTHVRALSDNIIKELKGRGQSLWHIEGEREASWILLDFGDVVCHIFLSQTRAFYSLEKLWEKSPLEYFKEKPHGKKTAKAKKKAKPKKKKRSKK